MKRFVLFIAMFLCFIVAYGCADVAQESSSPISQGQTSSNTDESGDITSVDESSLVKESEISSSDDVSFESTSSDVSSEEITSEEITSEDVTSEDITSEEVTSEDVTSEDVTSEDVTSEDVTSEDPVFIPMAPSEEGIVGIGDAEWINGGYLLYNGAAYSAARYNPSASQSYATVYNAYAEAFPNTRITAINHPGSALNISNPLVSALMTNQGEVLDKMEADIFGDVNFVNLKEIFTQHRGEYLYFKSDYHWTQLGAYYAYCEFAKSIGLTATPLSAFEMQIVTEDFHGRVIDYAMDSRLEAIADTIYAFMPRKEHTMTVYNNDGVTISRVFDNCIQTSVGTYSIYTRGDQPFIHINVPENDQSKTVLVIKDSSANAFIPFLTEHYGNILVVDPRAYIPEVDKIVNAYGVGIFYKAFCDVS